MFSTGGWLTHGGFVLDTNTDFLAVTERRLTPSRAREEWSKLRQRRIHSVWALAYQDSSHVGAVGVGFVSLRRAPVTQFAVEVEGWVLRLDVLKMHDGIGEDLKLPAPWFDDLATILNEVEDGVLPPKACLMHALP